MYAIIRAGGKQAKVQSGDVIDIERVKGDSEQLSFSPLLVVDDKGTAVSDRSLLANATVTAKVLGEGQGPKIDIYKYKNKTGYSRRQGHRQKYTRIEITGIELPGAAKPKAKTASSKPAAAPAANVAEAPPAVEGAEAPAKSAAPKPAAKAAAAKPAAAKAATPKPAAKPARAKAEPSEPAAKKPATPRTPKPPVPEE